jgi:hypothetical protein
MRAMAVLALLAVLPGAAAAGDMVVVESYAGDRPADAAEVLAPLYAGLAEVGAVPAAELVDALHDRLSRPARAAEGAGFAAAAALVEKGYDGHWLSGEFEPAIVALGRAVGEIDADPGALADVPARRDLRLKALVGIALANKRLGNAEAAVRAMAEVIRSFPDRDFNRSLFGPEAHDLYREVAADVARLPAGTLRVDVDDDAVVVFVNDRFAGTGSLAAELPPGRYRVYVKKGNRDGRRHDVDVHSGETSRLSVSWRLDAALRTAGAATLAFETEAARAHDETALAIRVARAAGADSVAVIGIREHEGRRAVVGSLLSLDSGSQTRGATLALEPVRPGPDGVRALVRYLALGEPSDAIIVTRTARPPPPRARSLRSWKWLTLATGTAAVATGAVLVSIDGPILDDAGNHTPDQYDTATPGYVLAGAGIALVATGVILWLRDDPADERATTVTVLPTDDGASIGLAGSF